MIVDGLTLYRCIAKGEKSEIYLTSKKNDNTNYIAKKYERIKIEGTIFYDSLKNEVIFCRNLKHPNIINYFCVKKTKKHLYIILEYCNGGNLSNILDKYQKEFGKPFSQEIIQHLMRQIIDVLIIFIQRSYFIIA